MRVGSLFSGIGGIELGLERAGFETAWFVEWEPYAQAVLKKHWPNIPIYGDSCSVDWSTVEPIDVLTGGFPCQPHSTAGKRKASEDERDLWKEYLKAIWYLKPRWIVAENVRGLLSSENGRFFARILSDLAEAGYDAEWKVISAQELGAKHRRERIIIVAYANSDRLEKDTIDPILCEQTINEECSRWAATVCDTSLSVWNEQMPNLTEGCGVGDGIPCRVDRLRCLGNAVVPQMAQAVGEAIKEAEGEK
jgi:DNA (cytosine-5)-methyltransferase 1